MALHLQELTINRVFNCHGAENDIIKTLTTPYIWKTHRAVLRPFFLTRVRSQSCSHVVNELTPRPPSSLSFMYLYRSLTNHKSLRISLFPCLFFFQTEIYTEDMPCMQAARSQLPRPAAAPSGGGLTVGGILCIVWVFSKPIGQLRASRDTCYSFPCMLHAGSRYQLQSS